MIDHLNHVPHSLLEEARSLTGPGAVEAFLIEHTSPECWHYLAPFVDEVVLGREPVESWMRGQVVVPDFSLAEQLYLDRAALLAPLGGGFSHRIVPSADDWPSGVTWIGAPALVLPDSDYRYSVPDQAIALGRADTEAVGNQTVALRRWIAARLALVVKPRYNVESIDQLVEGLEEIPSLEDWSDDARLAASALICEFNEVGQAENRIPGMGGSDEWYGR